MSAALASAGTCRDGNNYNQSDYSHFRAVLGDYTPGYVYLGVIRLL